MIRREESGWSPVLHLKLFNPVDDVMGLPPLGAARRALDLHNASADWAKVLIDNSAKPSGALVYGAGGRLPDDQYETLKAELEAHYAGAANAGRPSLLEGGLEWQPMSLSPSEMDFQEARNAAAREIALALGVRPMLLGIPGDNTYSNYREANLAFWRMTVLPRAEKTVAALSLWLDAPFDGDVDVRCDMDRVPALSVERDALWARLESASFATLDDSYANIDAWLADEVESAFAAQESAAFVSDDGTVKPRGFLDYEIVAEASNVWGKIGSVAGDFTLDDAADQVIDLIYTPKSQFRASARFVMNRRTVSAVRKLKDVDGRYLWQPGSGGDHGLWRDRDGRHAGYRSQQRGNSVRGLPARLPDVRPTGRTRAARPVFGQAVRAVLHDQARRWRGSEF